MSRKGDCYDNALMESFFTVGSIEDGHLGAISSARK
jgi:transposase InsO family protein